MVTGRLRQAAIIIADIGGRKQKMTNLTPNYNSYLLRLWRDGPGEAWRGSLQNTADGTVRLFADMESLVSFLKTQTEVNASKGMRAQIPIATAGARR